MEQYLVFVETFGLDLLVLNLFDGGLSDKELAERNTHGVPEEAITRMRERFEHDWRSADPRPPWERDWLLPAPRQGGTPARGWNSPDRGREKFNQAQRWDETRFLNYYK